MADALISPAVGGAFWAVSAGLIARSARKARQTLTDSAVPLMGVLGAFVFAAQMINFTIPGTGSSGHIGGGLLLAVLLGPHAAFLVIASVLTMQALFFADGGLLALGCNIFNLGFFPSFIAYPFIYRPLAGNAYGARRGWVAALVGAIVGLQLGALCVVLQTRASGISDLPTGAFLLLMQPIHLAIGVGEGLATAAVVSFVARARSGILPAAAPSSAPAGLRPILIGFTAAALLLGGIASWFASTHPDGLEWSIAKVSGREELDAPETGAHRALAGVQKATALMPEYDFPAPAAPADGEATDESWPAVSAGTSVAGILGGLLTLVLAGLFGYALRFRAPRPIRAG